MDRSILLVTAENVITIWLMILALFVLFAVVGRVYQGMRGKVSSGATTGVPSEQQWSLMTGGAALG